MKVTVESSRLIKPSYANPPPPPTPSSTTPVPEIRLSVFDKVAFDGCVPIIYFFRPPVPPNSHFERGLANVLTEYREYAGRFAAASDGSPVILLNDAGARLVEASVDIALGEILPLKPSMKLRCLHPSTDSGDRELLLIQLTRFACGSLAVAYNGHHRLADGHAVSNFLVSWGLACRGLPFRPALHLCGAAIFPPREPPEVRFDHRSIEFKPIFKSCNDDHATQDENDITVHKAHFTLEFLAKLKAKASSEANGRLYTTFESLMAHLWKALTKARRLGGHETTQLRVAVNGLARLKPRVPSEYFGNLVLWARPRAKVRELTSSPLRFAAELIHSAVAGINDEYFRSFVDFASSGAVEKEGLVSRVDAGEQVLWPNMDVDSWLRFPFYDVDFGGGRPFLFAPSYLPVEGQAFLLPSFIGDGSIEAFVLLFTDNVASFKDLCYCLD